jgi:hypothetical protein
MSCHGDMKSTQHILKEVLSELLTFCSEKIKCPSEDLKFLQLMCALAFLFHITGNFSQTNVILKLAHILTWWWRQKAG